MNEPPVNKSFRLTTSYHAPFPPLMLNESNDNSSYIFSLHSRLGSIESFQPGLLFFSLLWYVFLLIFSDNGPVLDEVFKRFQRTKGCQDTREKRKDWLPVPVPVPILICFIDTHKIMMTMTMQTMMFWDEEKRVWVVWAFFFIRVLLYICMSGHTTKFQLIKIWRLKFIRSVFSRVSWMY